MIRPIRTLFESSYLHLATSLAMFFVIGCGAGDDKPRVAVEGRVTLNGKELPTGLVSLIPNDPNGETAVAVIENGKYVIDRVAGPTPGSYKVLVHSQSPTGRKVRDADDPSKKIDELREAIPPQYNAHSTLLVEIKPDSNQTHDLALKVDSKSLSRNSRR